MAIANRNGITDPRTTKAIITAVAFAGIAAISYFSYHHSSSDAILVTNNNPPRITDPPRVSTSERNASDIEFEERLRKVREKLTTSRFSHYLEAHQWAPSAAIAVFDLVGDKSILLAALRSSPDNQEILLRLAVLFHQDEDNEKYFDALAKVNDPSSLVQYVLASHSSSQKNPGDFLSHLRAAVEKTAPELLSRAQLLEMRRACRSIGLSEADLMAVTGVSSPYQSAAANRVFAIGMDLFPLLETESDEAKYDVAGVGVAWTEHLRSMRSQTAAAELFALRDQGKFLAALPPDTEFGNSGLTVSEQSKKLEQERQATFSTILKANDLLPTLTAAQLEDYLDEKAILGEFDAMRNLLDRLSSN